MRDIEKEYEITDKERAEYPPEKLISLQNTRMEVLTKLKQSMELRKNMILRRSKVFEGHLKPHSFMDFEESEGFECLPANQKTAI